MFPRRATNIEDSLLTQFARFLEFAIPNVPQAFSVFTTPRNNTAQITSKYDRKFESIYHFIFFAASTQAVKYTLQQSGSLDFCHFIRSLEKRHQWTCWRAGQGSREGLVLKQNAVTLIISYWSLISALLKGPIMMFNWLCRMNKHASLSYHSFLPCFVCSFSKRRSLACHIAPSLSSSKTNKDVKHQSCSWLIKEDLKYFPLCLTWFWVSPTRGITTGRNKMTLFFLLLLCFSVTEVKQTKLEPVLWSCWL